MGAIATEILLAKGAGAALKGIKGIAALDNLLTKLDDFKALTKVKVAETFSDEAAQTAVNRLRAGLQQTTLYAGIRLTRWLIWQSSQ